MAANIVRQLSHASRIMRMIADKPELAKREHADQLRVYAQAWKTGTPEQKDEAIHVARKTHGGTDEQLKAVVAHLEGLV
jgi:hypothetical protein